MKINALTLGADGYPEELTTISGPPKQLFYIGAPLTQLLQKPAIAIVGSRSVTPYGRQVTAKIARELAIQGVVIISGLAIGVDAIAHQATVEAGGLAVAVLPSDLEHIYPASNRQLAKRILEQGGALVTEYKETPEAFKSNFVARNRIVAGLAQGVLITEAAERSGSLHTANFALEQGKEVMCVPGNITSPTSVGTNNLIRSGAALVSSAEDVLRVLGLESSSKNKEVLAANAEEAVILTLLKNGLTNSGELLTQSELDAVIFNQTLTMLEISGKIRPLGAGHWSLC